MVSYKINLELKGLRALIWKVETNNVLRDIEEMIKERKLTPDKIVDIKVRRYEVHPVFNFNLG